MELNVLTDHRLTLWKGDRIAFDQEPDGPAARCAEERHPAGTVTVGGVEITLSSVGFGAVSGLPSPRKGVLNVVSRAAAEAVPGRDDVVYPDRPVRDEQGRIIGCRALARVKR